MNQGKIDYNFIYKIINILKFNLKKIEIYILNSDCHLNTKKKTRADHQFHQPIL